MVQRSLILLKPDCLQRGIAGEIINRFEIKGFKFIGMKMLMISNQQAEFHYEEHRNKPF